jgi:oligopeptide transport system ATP-binding protein
MTSTTDQGVVEVSGLRKEFALPGGQERTVAVDGVSFSLPQSGSLGIVGESGSGKSTVARLLMGLSAPDEGRILVEGTDRSRPARNLREVRRRAREMQIVFQDPYTSLDPRQTPRQCLDEVLRLHTSLGNRDRSRRTDELLDNVGLSGKLADSRPRRLSGGQRQRVAIARALAPEPAVVLLDEAVSALDVLIQAQIVNLLCDIRDATGTALIVISHDLGVVRQLTETCLVMRRGRVVESGLTKALLSNPAHPYSAALVASVPQPGWVPTRLDRSKFDHPPLLPPGLSRIR